MNSKVQALLFVTKRATAFFMTLIMMLGMLGMSPIALAAEEGGRAADPSTLTGWESSFGPDVTDTSDVGRIITDKTVVDGDVTLEPAGLTVSRSSSDNFLVGLSAVSSNKSIIGQSTIPVDVMLVLDVSGSMGNGDSGSDSIPDMVSATNQSIQTLLDLNIHNRVGVILYSGNSDFGNSSTQTATVLLELNRYDSDDASFLQYSSRQGERVSVSDGLKYEGGQEVPSANKSVTGGTYTQNGMYRAMEQLCATQDTDVDGTKRIPIIVLMSDGAPTAATTNYANVGTSNIGNGGSTSDSFAFLNQLTGAYARNRMEDHYGREGLIYTLGLGLNHLGDDSDVAQAVLDPTQSNRTIRNYWTTYQNTEVNGQMSIQYGRDRYQITKIEGISDGNYVDAYFAANNSSDLNRAFAEIVEEIIIQSRYYPTDTGAGTPNLSGYIAFEDAIGEYMEVKKVSGLVYEDTLYSGAEFAQMIAENTHGGILDTEDGDIVNFIDSIATRLGITEQQAEALLQSAIATGDLYYQHSNNFSNDVTWYANEAGEYIAPYVEGEPAPELAAYINKSYTFAGNSVGTVYGENMMYITARVETDIKTQSQIVRLEVPAALVPMVQYNITIDTDDMETATQAQVERVSAYPMRFFYEVGIRSDITEENVANVVREDYPFVSEDVYTFYTNQWDSTSGQAETTVEFYPSQENEFYFYASNTAIYNQAGQPLRTAPQEGETYYYHHYVFGTDNTLTTQSEAITSEALEYARRDSGTGQWYIPKGTSKFTNSSYVTQKTQNTTQTASYSLTPSVVVNKQTQQVYVSVGLGNNGKLSMAQAKNSLIISKTVNGTYADPDQEFTFTVNLFDSAQAALPGEYQYTGSKTGTITSGDVITLTDGQSIEIEGLPVSSTYQVIETLVDGYTPDQQTISGAIGVGTGEDTQARADFVNTYALQELTLEGRTYLSGTKTLTGRDWKQDDSFTFALEAGNDETKDAVDTGSVVLPDSTTATATYQNHNFQFGDIVFKAPGTYVFTIREIGGAADQDDGVAYDTSIAKITIVVENNGDGTMSIAVPTYEGDLDFANTYTAQPTTGTVNGKKSLEGKNLEAGEFTFEISAVTNGAPLPVQTVVSHDADGGFAFAPISFVQEGDYTYQVIEHNDKKDGYTYDDTVYQITFHVEDDTQGNLQVTSTEVTKGGESAQNITFHNSYQALPAVLSDELAGQKTVEVVAGDYTLQAGDFTFEISAMTQGAPLPANTTVSNESDGKYQFGEITFTQAGVYRYEIAENAQNALPGISYDPSIYQVSIVVEDIDGQLTVTDISKSLQGSGEVEEMNFHNTYDPKEVHFAIHGQKTLEGRELTAGEFTFVLKEGENTIDTAVNTQGGSFAFAPISYEQEGTYTYLVSEQEGTDDTIHYDNTVYTVTVKVEDVGGVLQASASYEPGQLLFQNSYTPNSVTLTGKTALSGTKVLLGRECKEGEFEFALWKEGKKVDTAVNDENGNFAFGDITFTREGVYYYTMTEVNNGLGGVTYDRTVYTVQINVEDAGGQLTAQVIYQKAGEAEKLDGAEFINSYQPQKTSVTLSGGKILNGRELRKGEFTFQLKDENGKVISQKTNDVNGTVQFDPMEFEAEGTYHYTVSEVADGASGVEYDSSVYHVTIDVSDDGNGHLTTSIAYTKAQQPVDGIIFINTYQAESAGGMILTAYKTLDGRELREGEFVFQLKDQEGNVISQATNQQDGAIAFAPLELQREGTYYFEISEQAGSEEGVTYDDAVYAVKVEVVDEQGKLVAKAEYENGQAPVFHNIYENPTAPADAPQTGDPNRMLLWLAVLGVSAVGVIVIVVVTRRRKS